MIVELLAPVAAAEAADERPNAPWRPRCSASGTQRCIRADVYKAIGQTPKPLPGRTVLVFDDGDWHEMATVGWIERTVYRVHSQQMVVEPAMVPGSHGGYTCGQKGCGLKVAPDVIHGHLDCIVTDPIGAEYVCEIKSSSRFIFEKWAGGHEVPWDYVTQLALNIVGARKIGLAVERTGLLIVKNKDTSAYMELQVRAPTVIGAGEEPTEILSGVVMEGETPVPIAIIDAERQRPRLLSDAVTRFGEIARYRDARTLPARPFEYGHWRCEYCQFGSTCWDGYVGMAKAGASAAPSHVAGNDADLIRACAAAAGAKGSAEKIHDELRSRLKVRMMDLGVRAASADDEDGTPIVARLDMRPRTTIDADLLPEDVRKRAEVTTQSEVLTVRLGRKKVE